MNLEGLLEDIEAQGFFESRSEVETQHPVTFCKYAQVLMGGSSQRTFLLSMPIIGQDFIAGFTKLNGRTMWLLVKNYSLTEILGSFSTIQNTSAGIQDVVKQQLIKTNLRLKLDDLESELTGKITAVVNNHLCFLSTLGKSLWIPIGCIAYMVVDKISIQQKVSAT